MLSPCDQGQWHSYAWSKRMLHPTQYAVKAGPVSPRRRCFCNKSCQSAEHGSGGVEPNCKGCSWLFCSAAFYPQPFSHCCWAGWAILLKRRSALEHGFGHFSVKWPLVRYLGKMMKEATHWSYFENSGIWIWAKIKSHWFWHSYIATVYCNALICSGIVKLFFGLIPVTWWWWVTPDVKCVASMHSSLTSVTTRLNWDGTLQELISSYMYVVDVVVTVQSLNVFVILKRAEREQIPGHISLCLSYLFRSWPPAAVLIGKIQILFKLSLLNTVIALIGMLSSTRITCVSLQNQLLWSASYSSPGPLVCLQYLLVVVCRNKRLWSVTK